MLIHLQPKVCSTKSDLMRSDRDQTGSLGPISVTVACHPLCSRLALDLASSDASTPLAPPSSRIPRQCPKRLLAKISKLANEKKPQVGSQGCGSALSQIKPIPWCIPAGKVISGEPLSLSGRRKRRKGRGQTIPRPNKHLAPRYRISLLV